LTSRIRGGLDRLAYASWAVGPASTWATVSKVGQKLAPLKGEVSGGSEEKGARDKVTEEEREGGSGMAIEAKDP